MVVGPKHKAGKFTYSDYLGWGDEECWELIDGEAWAMSPAPTTLHQRVLAILTSRLVFFFGETGCQVFPAPTDVVLTEQDVVQPDLLVVCDGAKILPSHIAGAPDLVVEILSPSTAAKDHREKLALYEKHGVREYLIVHSEERFLEQFVLGEDGRYGRATIVAADETYKSANFPGLEVGLAGVFGL